MVSQKLMQTPASFLTGEPMDHFRIDSLINYSAAVVEKVLEYLTFKNAYINIGPKEELPDFAGERLPPELALELWVSVYL